MDVLRDDITYKVMSSKSDLRLAMQKTLNSVVIYSRDAIDRIFAGLGVLTLLVQVNKNGFGAESNKKNVCILFGKQH